jgi:N-acyl-D-aspartate/D-glutamate deacylase
MHELVIRAGSVVDGTGAPARHADVAIDAGRIVEVGDVPGRGVREIDAAGSIVTPGWVDIHTHYDGQVTWDPIVAPSSVNGVTSIAMGNCGVGFAPARPDRHGWLIGLLEGVEDIPGSALAEGLPWDWESFPEFLDAVDRRPHTIDIGAHMPHAALRTYVMGERGADHRVVPTEDDITTMRSLLAEAVDAGALGFATSRTEVHRTGDGDFVGTMSATPEELLGVTSALTAARRGVVQLVSDLYLTTDDSQVEREMALLARLAREVRRPLSFTVEQVDAAPNRWRDMMALIDRLNAEGLDVKGQVANRPIGLVVGLSASANPFQHTRSYREIQHLPLAERVAAMRTTEVRDQILAERRGKAMTGFAEVLTARFDRLFPMADEPDYEPPPESSLAALAARNGRPADEFTYDAMTADDGGKLFYLALNNFADGNLDVVREMLTAPNALFGLSDGGAHCNFICDATFPTTSLTLWARDRARGPRLPLEHLVHHQTQRPAAHVGWRDRGVLAPGYLADLNVIDLDRLQLHRPYIKADLPAGGTRLLQAATGYRFTVKSGSVTFVDGESTGEFPGRVVRGEQEGPAR